MDIKPKHVANLFVKIQCPLQCSSSFTTVLTVYLIVIWFVNRVYDNICQDFGYCVYSAHNNLTGVATTTTTTTITATTTTTTTTITITSNNNNILPCIVWENSIFLYYIFHTFRICWYYNEERLGTYFSRTNRKARSPIIHMATANKLKMRKNRCYVNTGNADLSRVKRGVALWSSKRECLLRLWLR